MLPMGNIPDSLQKNFVQYLQLKGKLELELEINISNLFKN